MAIIEVKRNDYKATTFRGIERPAHYTVHYYYEGIELAYYDSRDDVIYLNSHRIDTNADGTINRDRSRWDQPRIERALNCKFAEAYRTLFDMLGADETTQMSEYCNA